MRAVKRYLELLRVNSNWDEILLENSRLPGPRANLELAYAVAELGTEEQFLRWAALDPLAAPGDKPEGFLAVCGVMGLGYLAARGNLSHLPLLREMANDPRWRVREAVALGLQKYGESSLDDLLENMEEWAGGSLLERRAVVATLCEPALLSDSDYASRVIELLDRITSGLLGEPERRAEEFKVLRKALGYGWSVAVVAHPKEGKPRFERWVASEDADIRWMVRENLKKKRLLKMDTSWVDALKERVRD